MPALLMKRVCVIGCGAIGSLYAAHLARVAEVWAFVRREEHARALNREGLRVSGAHDFHVSLKATTQPDELPDCELGIIATKATQVEDSIAPVGHRFDKGAIISAQNGLGCEEIIAAHTRGLCNSRHNFHERHAAQRYACAIRVGHGHLDRAFRTS